ncbi:MAG: Vgb family protein [Nitrososphaerota archaeon]
MAQWYFGDRNGIVWTAGSRSHILLSFDPEDGQIKSTYPIRKESSSDVMKGGSLMAWSMVEDNDGFIWFSQFGPDRLWRFDPKTEKFHVFHSLSAPPFQMKVDKGTGNIWFTTLLGNTLGVIQNTENKNESNPEYKITEFDVGSDSNPSGLFLEKDHVWISQILNHKLVKFNVVKDSNGFVKDVVRISEIPSSEAISIYTPTDLIIQNDNLIWFTEHGTSTITRYHTESQKITRFPTSANPYQTTTLPFWMRESISGDGLWFNEHTGNRIAFLNTKEMTLLEYEIPTRPSDGYVVYPLGITIDPSNSNKLWFSEWNTDKIAVVDLNIPVSFDIHSNVDKVVLSGVNDTTNIDVELIRNDSSIVSNNSNNIVSLKASSSMMPNGGFANVTASFSRDTINLGEIKETEVGLSLQNDSATSGNYTLVISATDGIVTKSIFLDLEIAG